MNGCSGITGLNKGDEMIRLGRKYEITMNDKTYLFEALEVALSGRQSDRVEVVRGYLELDGGSWVYISLPLFLLEDAVII